MSDTSLTVIYHAMSLTVLYMDMMCPYNVLLLLNNKSESFRIVTDPKTIITNSVVRFEGNQKR